MSDFLHFVEQRLDEWVRWQVYYCDMGLGLPRKSIEALLGPEDLFRFQSHLVQHGDEICLARSPRCGECGVVELCGFKRKVGLVGASESLGFLTAGVPGSDLGVRTGL